MGTQKGSGAMARWEDRLGEAARRFAERVTGPAGSGREAEATLLRLGFPFGEVAAVLRDRQGVCARRLAEMRAAIERELKCLARHARAGRFDYDLNRHIAVFRAARHLGDPAPRAQASRGTARRAARAAKSSATAAFVRSSIRP